MPKLPLGILLDQNIPRDIAAWLKSQRPDWTVRHVNDVGLTGKADVEIFLWAQKESSIVITFDEDFADTRTFKLGAHCGIIRLRVWPTTSEATMSAIQRLLASVSDEQLNGSLVIVDQNRIRLRPKP